MKNNSWEDFWYPDFLENFKESIYYFVQFLNQKWISTEKISKYYAVIRRIADLFQKTSDWQEIPQEMMLQSQEFRIFEEILYLAWQDISFFEPLWGSIFLMSIYKYVQTLVQEDSEEWNDDENWNERTEKPPKGQFHSRKPYEGRERTVNSDSDYDIECMMREVHNYTNNILQFEEWYRDKAKHQREYRELDETIERMYNDLNKLFENSSSSVRQKIEQAQIIVTQTLQKLEHQSQSYWFFQKSLKKDYDTQIKFLKSIQRNFKAIQKKYSQTLKREQQLKEREIDRARDSFLKEMQAIREERIKKRSQSRTRSRGG